ncbi:MAG: EF-P lysine aminoacylase GenX [Nitrospinae bacterium]|nr:EF-P lysine aminoacylase GenX [Nitrospinota bacterium]
MDRQSNLLDILRLRSSLLEKVRLFFKERGVLEVETPILVHAPAIEEHIEPFVTNYPDIDGRPLYLISSPEYAMKRLLTMGAGSIYQITKVFRNEEEGRLHNPEFSMIEWYRVGGDMEGLMQEVEEFISSILGFDRANRISYAEAFERYAGINPHTDSIERIREVVLGNSLYPPDSLGECRDGWLSFVLAYMVEPNLGFDTPTIVYDYPASQAALSKVRGGEMPLAERFELYLNGIELCNGYHELTDYDEHIKRFGSANDKREISGKGRLPADKLFLEAVKTGLPECSGVSFGFDRMIMIAAGVDSIDKVIPFTIKNA